MAEASGYLDFFVQGHIESSGFLDLYTFSHIESTGNLLLYAGGLDYASGNLEFFTKGHIPVSGYLDLYTLGHISVTGSINFFLDCDPLHASGRILFSIPEIYPLSTGGLISYWKLEEPSGTRFDSINGNHLIASGNPLGVLGKIDTGCSFNRSLQQRLWLPDNTSLSMGDIDYTIGIWAYMNAADANYHSFISKWKESTSNREYRILYDHTIDRFSWQVSRNGIATQAINANNFGAPSGNRWYCIIVWHDAVNNQLGIQVNNTTPNTTSYSLGVVDGSGDFEIGGNLDTGLYTDGIIDEVGIWKNKVLSASERNSFYNDGIGLEFPFASSTFVHTNQLNLFLAGPDKAAFSGSINLSTAGRVTELSNSIDFYVANSGISNLIWLFTAGEGIGQGLYPFNDNINLFIQRDEAAILQLFCRGTPTSTGTIDFYIAGAYLIDTNQPSLVCQETGVLRDHTLNSGIIAFWHLEEPSGLRFDSVGVNHLSGVNNPGYAVGILGSSVNLVEASTQWLELKDNADLSTGDIDFTFTCWAYSLDTSYRPILNKWDTTGNNFEYRLYSSAIDNKWGWDLSAAGFNIFTVKPNLTISTGVWYFLHAWHDATNDRFGLQINNGIQATGAITGVFDSTTPFRIGFEEPVGVFFNGRIDEVGFWKRLLTSGEVTDLYNNGIGSGYPFYQIVPSSVCFATGDPTNLFLAIPNTYGINNQSIKLYSHGF